MKRVVITAAVLLTMSGTAFSAIDPNVSTPSLTSVVSTCERVAETQRGRGSEENPLQGQCIGATQDFISGLQAALIAPSDFDEQLVTLVSKLVPLVELDETCDAFDDEVARAIQLASQNIRGTDETALSRKAQLLEISNTIASCEDALTGAIPPEVSPTV
jgi:hypothetical protein